MSSLSSSVHAASKFQYLQRALIREVTLRRHERDDLLEERKIFPLLLREERILPEERNGPIAEAWEVIHLVVPDSIQPGMQNPTAEMLLKKLKDELLLLSNVEACGYLPWKLVVFPFAEGDIATTFSICEPREVPTQCFMRYRESFLLIACTEGIVTHA